MSLWFVKKGCWEVEGCDRFWEVEGVRCLGKVQGNLDPGVLFGSKAFIRDRVLDTVRKAGNWGHILNLGHGVLPETPEENVAFFFETAKNLNALV